MNLEAIAEAVTDAMLSRGYAGNPWEGEEYRYYFDTGSRNAKAWLVIDDEGVRLRVSCRAGSDQDGKAGSWRANYLNALRAAKRAAELAAA